METPDPWKARRFRLVVPSRMCPVHVLRLIGHGTFKKPPQIMDSSLLPQP